MEHISVNGEKYVKASSIARELGYTSDYVGQLARGGKVDAKLVGRSWFVNEQSIREHKRDRYRSTAQKSKESLQEAIEAEKHAAEHEPTMRAESNFYRKAGSVARYESDEHDLVPHFPEKYPENVENKEILLSKEEVEPERENAPFDDAVEVKLHIEDVYTQPSEAEREVLRKARELRKTEEREEIRHGAPIHELSLPVKPHSGGMKFAIFAAFVLALTGSAVFLGLEERLTITAEGNARTYAFSLATTIEALEYIRR